MDFTDGSTDLNQSQSENLSSHSVNVEKLARIVSQLENIEKQKKDLNLELKEICNSAKNQGFDVTALKKIVLLRLSPKQNKEKLEYEMNMFELYKSALKL